MARHRHPYIDAASVFVSGAVLTAVVISCAYIVAGPDYPEPSTPAIFEADRPTIEATERPTAAPRLRTLDLGAAAPDCIDASDRDEIEEAVLAGRLDETAIDDPDSITEAC